MSMSGSAKVSREFHDWKRVLPLTARSLGTHFADLADVIVNTDDSHTATYEVQRGTRAGQHTKPHRELGAPLFSHRDGDELVLSTL